MIKRAFDRQKHRDFFAESYNNGEIETKPIAFYLDAIDYPGRYWNFWHKNKELGIVLKKLVERNALSALSHTFGEADFLDKYVLDYEGLTMITPSEVVVTTDNDFIGKLVRLEESYTQFVIDYLFIHYSVISAEDRKNLEKIKEVMNADNKIVFQ